MNSAQCRIFVILWVLTFAHNLRAEPPEDGRADPSAALEEVIVTARKTEESMQRIPLSISAFTSSTLDRSAIDNFEDLRFRIPNYQYYAFNVGLPHYFLRGIGSENRSGAADSAVGVFIDDVYIGRGAGTSSDFFDLERIEVLRGPQGTLFGRNVVGGAISLVSNKPSFDVESLVSGTVGNNGRFDAQGTLNLPMTETMAARIAVLSRDYEGHALNLTTGNHLEDQDRLLARASFLASPKESLRFVVIADSASDNSKGTWWHLGAEGPFSQGNANVDPRSGRNSIDGQQHRDDWGVTANLEAIVGGLTITSISAYRHHHYSASDNTTGLFVADLDDPDRFNFHHTLFIQGQRQTSSQASQEVRLKATSSSQLEWLAGLFYLHEKVDRQPETQYRFQFFNDEGTFGFNAHNETKSFAAFGHINYSITERLELSGGVRWTRDAKDHTTRSFGDHFAGFTDGGQPVQGWSVQADGSWSEPTPAASLSIELSDDHLLYTTVSRGFKSGGFNDSGSEKASVATPFSPELAWNYEIGLKSGFWEGRGRANASLFYLDYDDIQIDQVVQPDPARPPFEMTANAGESKVQGVELEWELVLVDRTLFYGSYAFIDSTISDLTVSGIDFTGNKLARTPSHKINVGAMYSLPIGALGAITWRLEYGYESDYFAEISNSPLTSINSHKVIDGGVSWSSPGDKWGIQVWGKNLSDELYVVTATEVPVEDRYEKHGPPRTYGVTLTYRH